MRVHEALGRWQDWEILDATAPGQSPCPAVTNLKVPAGKSTTLRYTVSHHGLRGSTSQPAPKGGQRENCQLSHHPHRCSAMPNASATGALNCGSPVRRSTRWNRAARRTRDAIEGVRHARAPGVAARAFSPWTGPAAPVGKGVAAVEATGLPSVRPVALALRPAFGRGHRRPQPAGGASSVFTATTASWRAARSRPTRWRRAPFRTASTKWR